MRRRLVLQTGAAGDDRGRNILALPDDRLVAVGSGVFTKPDVDGMAVILNPNGTPDTTFAPDGYKLYSFGGTDEAFYGLAVSPDGKVAYSRGLAPPGE